MLDSLRRGQRWLTGLFIAVIGVVFAAFIGLGGPFRQASSTTAVVELDGERLGVPDFERVRTQQEQRYRDALGDQFDSKTAAKFLDTQALRLLVDSAVLAHAAEELGFRVTKDEIQRTVREIPGFRDENGRFNQKAFLDVVEYQYGSQRNFLRVIRDDLLKQKLGRLLAEQAQVSEAEATSAARYQLERARIAYVALDTASLPPGQEVSDDDVKAYLDAHRDELLALYQERRDEFTTPEKVHVRHLLIRVDDPKDETQVAAARERATKARQRIVDGASFEDVAMELSEDPGSRDKGGDLGFVARGEISGALEKAAFSQPEGVVGDVIQTDAGFDIVLVEGHQAAGVKPFDEVALELAREKATAQLASERAHENADALAQAIRDGSSLEDAARARGLTLERTDLLRRRRDGFIPGLGASPEVMAMAFALRPDAASSPRVFDVGTRLVLIELLDRPAVDEQEVAKLADTERTQMLETRRNSLVQDWIDARRTQLMDEQRLLVNPDLVLTQ